MTKETKLGGSDLEGLNSLKEGMVRKGLDPKNKAVYQEEFDRLKQEWENGNLPSVPSLGDLRSIRCPANCI